MKKASVKTDHSGPSKTTPITGGELFQVFQEVVEKWAFLPCAEIGPLVDGPAHLPLERMVSFSGSVEGLLVVRAPHRFGQCLWENISGAESTGETLAHGDAFNEFVNLFFGHLSASLRRLAPGQLDPYLPQPSSPALWPQRRPQASLAALVEDMPVEVRLWLGADSLEGAVQGNSHE